MKCYENDSWDHIHKFHFLYFTNGRNKLEHLVTLGWKGFSVTNTIAYWAHLLATKKIECL
jgi:hypothetical protein